MKKSSYLLVCGMMAAVLLSGCGKGQATETEASTDDVSKIEEQAGVEEQEGNIGEQPNSISEPEEQGESAGKRTLKRTLKKDYSNDKVVEECEYDIQGNMVKSIYEDYMRLLA